MGRKAESHPSLPISRTDLPLSSGSRRTEEPFPEAVYEEIRYSPPWEKETVFYHSGEHRLFEGTSAWTFPLSLAQGWLQHQSLPTPVFQPHHLHVLHLAFHEMLLLTVTRSLLLVDVAILPRGDPEDGYDDAKEVSEPENNPVSGQDHCEVPRTREEGEKPRNAVRGKREMKCSTASYHVPFFILGELLQYQKPSLS